LREAERPRRQAKVQEDENDGQVDIKILTPVQINAFLDQVKDHKYRFMFMLAVFSGGRQGELLALRWSDVDWRHSQVHIQRTLNKDRNPEAACRLENVIFGENGSKMVAEMKKGVTTSAVTP
jgi:integrase